MNTAKTEISMHSVLVRRFVQYFLAGLTQPLRLGLWTSRVFLQLLSAVSRAAGISGRTGAFSFPFHIIVKSSFRDFLNHPVLTSFVMIPSIFLAVLVYFLKIMNLVFSPDMMFRKFLALVVFQSVYEIGGFWWRALRWATWTRVRI